MTDTPKATPSKALTVEEAHAELIVEMRRLLVAVDARCRENATVEDGGRVKAILEAMRQGGFDDGVKHAEGMMRDAQLESEGHYD